MKKQVRNGIFVGTGTGAGIMAILSAIIGPFMMVGLTLLPDTNYAPTTQSMLFQGILLGAVVGAVSGAICGAIGSLVVINFTITERAKKLGVDKKVIIEQLGSKKFVLLGTIGGLAGVFILIVCPFIYTLL